MKILLKGEEKMRSCTLQEFESIFHVRYTPTLIFQDRNLAIRNCPYILRNRFTAKENLELGEKYKEQVAKGFVADVSIRWINPVFGYGLFAETEMEKGAYVGEYTGLVRTLSRIHPDHNAYCFHYPTRFWSWNYMVVDSLKEGNELRFANHSDTPTMEPACMVDEGVLHLIFFTSRDVDVGEELTFNYGEDYWLKREKAR